MGDVIKCKCGKILAEETETQHGVLVLKTTKIQVPGGGDPWPYLICECGKTTPLSLSCLEEKVPSL